MSQLTLKVDEAVLARGREIARERGVTMDELFAQLVRGLPSATVAELTPLQRLWQQADAEDWRSVDGRPLTDEEMYDR